MSTPALRGENRIADRLLERNRACEQFFVFLAVIAPGGQDACFIGEVREQPRGSVLASTPYGGTRIVDMLVGDPLPRIC